jgi:dipeptidase E
VTIGFSPQSPLTSVMTGERGGWREQTRGMRLYLSSFRLGDRSDRLVDLVRRGGGPATVAVVANACDIDIGIPDGRRRAVDLELEALDGLGLEGRELDLRDYHAASGALERDLARVAALWVRGGNAFALRHAMEISGADRVIPRLLADDALVYAGYSAGACVLAPSLRGLELCDSPEDVLATYGVEAPWDGLGVLDRPFVPHLHSPGHPETELVARVANRYRQQGMEFWGLRDGQVLVVDGELADAVLL